MTRIKILTYVATAFFLFSNFSLFAEEYIKLSKDGVNIRFSPNTNSIVVAKGMKGDVFTLKKTEGNWCVISMFSGEYRYIHTSLAKKVATVAPLTSSADIKKKAFRELVKAQDKAVSESNATYPNDIYKQIDLERILYDKYELPIFRKYSIPPPWNSKLVLEGVKNGWI